MFEINAFFDVNFINPDLNTEKYGLKHGLKSLKFLYFSRCFVKKIVESDIIFSYACDMKKRLWIGRP